MTPRVGVIGVGHLAGYLVRGWLRHARRPPLLLSPRGEQTSRRLARHDGVRRARDNRGVVRYSDVVLICVRREQLDDALAGLSWRADQVAVSAAAGVPLRRLRDAVAPAIAVRAMPIAAASLGASPTPVFPAGTEADPLLSLLGPVLPMPDEQALDAAVVGAALYGWLHALMAETAAWTSARGVPPDTARTLVAHTLRAAGLMSAEHADVPLDEMVRTLATPGGITEAGLTVLRERGGLAAWVEACDAARNRLA